MRLPALPVREVLEPLREALTSHTAAVLVAPPGAGKTTLVPLALIDADWLRGRRIVMLEPRRLATRAAARRMASLCGERVGESVGYRIRRETRVGPATRVEVVTEAVLTRMLQSDPTLEGVGLVIFDEFHERSLNADLGLALSLAARRLFRDDLRLLVMSATLDATPVAELMSDDFGAAPVIVAEGREFPVETRYLERPLSRDSDRRIEPQVAAQVARALADEPGDVLVFLPGAGEIRRTAERLAALPLPARTDLHPLFGNLSSAEQDRAIAPSPAGRRKVVLATAIAQTSLTIEGVRVVVDSGWMRVPRFHPGTGLTGLETLRVTVDVADQRRGRAGRTAAGVCHRMWTAGEQHGLVPHLKAEILDADLTPLLLELALWGAGVEDLEWLDAPPAAGVEQALALLRRLELVAGDGSITAHGRRAAALGVHPRLGHMLVRAGEMGLAPLGCHLAALLGERDLLRRPGGPPEADVRLRLEALKRGPRGGAVTGHDVHRGRVARVVQEARALGRALGAAKNGTSSPAKGATGAAAKSGTSSDTKRRRSGAAGSGPLTKGGALGAAGSGPSRGATSEGGRAAAAEALTAATIERAGELLALAYPDRIGRRREAAGDGSARPDSAPSSAHAARYLLRNGRGAALGEGQGLAAHAWIVASDVGGRGRDARIYQAAPIEIEQVEELFAGQIEEVDEVRWNAEIARVEATRERRLDALVLSRAPSPEPDSERVAEALLDGVRAAGLRALPWNKKTRQLRERLLFLHRADPETWPDVSEPALMASLPEWLAPFLTGMSRLADLARLDLSEILWTHVGWPLRPTLEELAPTHLEVPSGSRIPLDYSDPESPALAVRLQEVFGLSATPKIGGGRVPLTIRLLSPAQRPVQVTTDLESFWRETYFEVKKELKGRYPKHYWPDDPLTAQATRRVRPKKS